MDPIILAVVFTALIGLAIYVWLIPIFIGNKTKNKKGIFWLDILLGWTFLGWVAALVWAVSAEKEEEKQDDTDDMPLVNKAVSAHNEAKAAIATDTRECPYCAETIKAKATVCRFCNKEVEPVAQNNSQIQQPTPKVNTAVNKCEMCGEPNKLNRKTCWACETPL